MRRKTKYMLAGLAAGSVIAALGDILIQWLQSINSGQKFTWEKYNGIRTLKVTALGAAIGTSIGYGLYTYAIEKEKALDFNPDDYLDGVLKDENIKSQPELLQQVLALREKIKIWLTEEFGDLLASSPLDSGSFYKRTAIKSNFDLDLSLVFKKECVRTLREMFEKVYVGLKSKFESKAIITRKTKVIEVEFNYQGTKIKFDIAPSKERGNYKRDKEVTLYKNPDWPWQKGSSFKTNLTAQRKITTYKPEVRRVIKLLKAYRDRNNLDMPTIIIEQCAVQALSNQHFGVNWSDKENLRNAMILIAKKMEQKSLIDIANTNNNLHNKVSDFDRYSTASQLYDDIDEIEKNPRYLKEIFEVE